MPPISPMALTVGSELVLRVAVQKVEVAWKVPASGPERVMDVVCGDAGVGEGTTVVSGDGPPCAGCRVALCDATAATAVTIPITRMPSMASRAFGKRWCWCRDMAVIS